ncbi:MAG: hypothetical protein EBS53_11360 [Bacteroidetes bacterium]|nr:hypothetical protein [Bacteroidota bacterium]
MRFDASEIDRIAPGTTFKEVSGKIMKTIPFPLAPLGEQRRGATALNVLLELCDQLERDLKSRLESYC